MFRIVLSTGNCVRLTRWHHGESLLALLQDLAGHIAAVQLSFESEVVAVSIVRVAKDKCGQPARAGHNEQDSAP